MKYKEELDRSMEWLGAKSDILFIGQSIKYSGNAIFNTLKAVPVEKKIELPVFEEVQMGISTGLALEGYVVVSCFPRFDFMLCCMNQLVNHLDKINNMSNGKMRPRVIIRTSIGSTVPLDGGIQHTQNYSQEFKTVLKDIHVVQLNEPEEIFPAFKYAYEREDSKSTLLIEWGDYYNEK